MDDPRAKDLLAEILDDATSSDRASTSRGGGMDALGDWQKLRDELMYQNRFFPEWRSISIASGAAVPPQNQSG